MFHIGVVELSENLCLALGCSDIVAIGTHCCLARPALYSHMPAYIFKMHASTLTRTFLALFCDMQNHRAYVVCKKHILWKIILKKTDFRKKIPKQDRNKIDKIEKIGFLDHLTGSCPS